MPAKSVLQTIGTVSSLILSYITLKITQNILAFDIQNPTDIFIHYPGFILTFLTVVIMVVTGLSYYNSRIEHESKTRFLYLLVALTHTILAPAALVIAIMKVQFGQYWWGALIGILMLIYWGSQQTESKSE